MKICNQNNTSFQYVMMAQVFINYIFWHLIPVFGLQSSNSTLLLWKWYWYDRTYFAFSEVELILHRLEAFLYFILLRWYFKKAFVFCFLHHLLLRLKNILRFSMRIFKLWISREKNFRFFWWIVNSFCCGIMPINLRRLLSFSCSFTLFQITQNLLNSFKGPLAHIIDWDSWEAEWHRVLVKCCLISLKW